VSFPTPRPIALTPVLSFAAPLFIMFSLAFNTPGPLELDFVDRLDFGGIMAITAI
jgi:hypothetical protein